MPSSLSHLEKRSMRIAGHHTSIALEPEFWAKFEVLAKRERKSLPKLIAEIDAAKPTNRSLASAVRVYTLNGGPSLKR